MQYDIAAQIQFSNIFYIFSNKDNKITSESILKFYLLFQAASLFEDSTKLANKAAPVEAKKNRRKANSTYSAKRKQQQQQQQQQQLQQHQQVQRQNTSDNESTISAEDEQLVPVGPSSAQNQFKPVSDQPDKFAFSTLMRQMAQKYQEKSDNEEK